MAVQVIKARKQKSLSEGSDEKYRVAAYCRVSTDSEEQESSYEAQCRHYEHFINANPEWALAGIYADEGISGTSTKHRDQFNQMISDCEKGKIDMIITKSISRWARNTIDSLKNIRKLKDLGIPVLFEKENINTMDAQGEVLLTILSSLAQQESESISKNVRMGIQYLYQQGKGRLNTTRFLGLTKGENGKTLVIIPEEADLVRRIYREYLEGYSPGWIARGLMEDEIPSPAGKPAWYQSTIGSILRNEKYCGDLLMQKYYVVDVLSHRVAKNEGQLPQYYVEDAHEPIIPKEVFYQVQGELRRRSIFKNKPGSFRMGSKIALTGRLICGKCGRRLKRYTYPEPTRTDWRCRRRAYEKRSMTKEVAPKCSCRNVLEREVQVAILAAFNELPSCRDELLRASWAVKNGDLKRLDYLIGNNQSRQDRINEKMEGLEEGDKQVSLLRAELSRLEDEKIDLTLKHADAANQEVARRSLLELIDIMMEKEYGGSEPDEEEEDRQAACYEYDEFFRRTRMEIPEGILDTEGKVVRFQDDFIIRYLENVIVHDDSYKVNFKAGLTIKVCA